MTRIGRWLLTLLLMYGVYTETGKWTTLAIFLIYLTDEVKALTKEVAD